MCLKWSYVMHLYHPSLIVGTPFSPALGSLPFQVVKNQILRMALHWFPITFRIQLEVLLNTYRALHGQAPAHIRELLHLYITCWSQRSLDLGLLTVPQSRLKTKGDHAFEVETFKKQLKTHLFRFAFV